MKKKTKIIIGLTLVVLIGIIIFVGYYNKNNSDNGNYSENIKNLYLNNGNNEIKDIPSQTDE